MDDGIVAQGGGSGTDPIALFEHHPSETVRPRRCKTWWTADEALVHDRDLEKVLSQRSGLKVVVIGLADPSEEAHGARPSEFELEHAEHEAFGLEDLIHGVAAIDHVDDLLHGWTVDLLVLGRDEDGSGTDELQLAERHDFAGEKAVNVVDTEVQRLWQESKAVVDLH